MPSPPRTETYAPADFVFGGVGDRAMRGQCDESDGQASSSVAQAARHQTAQEAIAGVFERLDIAELGGELPQHLGA
jgi:hypothetical protein